MWENNIPPEKNEKPSNSNYIWISWEEYDMYTIEKVVGGKKVRVIGLLNESNYD